MVLRIGVVGAGGNTKLRHLPGFAQIEGVTVTGVCNRSAESSQKVADEFGIARTYASWPDLIADPDIDAVCIGTWPNLHCPITLAALAAGKHVLTEARMAMDLTQARAMLAAADESDLVAMIVPAPFYLPYEPTLLKMLAAGDFGDLLEGHVYSLGGAFAPDAPVSWRQRRDLSGNNIMTMGILNETVRRYMGHERAVTAMGRVTIDQRFDPESERRVAVEIPDQIGIVAEHTNGATCVYHISTVARHGRGMQLEFIGSKGAIRLEHDKAFVAFGKSGFEELQVAPADAGGWRVEEDFVDAIREGRPVTHTSFADGVKYMEFTEAVQRSLAERRHVALPL